MRKGGFSLAALKLRSVIGSQFSSIAVSIVTKCCLIIQQVSGTEEHSLFARRRFYLRYGDT
jgi:hypothetical protein